jgi:hypothetical protein
MMEKRNRQEIATEKEKKKIICVQNTIGLAGPSSCCPITDRLPIFQACNVPLQRVWSNGKDYLLAI